MDSLVDSAATYAVALAVERWPEFLVGLAMLAVWRWLTWHKVRKQISALEDRMKTSAIQMTFNYPAGSDAGEDARHLRDALEAETVRSLRETIRSLPQEPLGNGHTYADLPDGTRIVSMDDGSYRLALPVRPEGIGIGVFPEPPAAVLSVRPKDADDG